MTVVLVVTRARLFRLFNARLRNPHRSASSCLHSTSGHSSHSNPYTFVSLHQLPAQSTQVHLHASVITNIKFSIVKPKRVKMSFSFATTLIYKLIALDKSQLLSASWNKKRRADRGMHGNCKRKGDVCDRQIDVMK